MVSSLLRSLLQNLIQTTHPAIIFLFSLFIWVCLSGLLYFLLFILLRRIFRKISGFIDDIVLTIISKPILIGVILYGLTDSIKAFQLPTLLQSRISQISNTVFIVFGTYVAFRIIKEVIIRYGQTWVNNTDSRVDDIVVPIVNLFGTLFLFLFSLLFILSYWGVNITSILVSAGLAGVIIGLALQDNLTNMFSGINLIMDAPFKINDLIVLDTGKICKVEKFGLRATQLYNIDEQTAVYIPNKDLSNSVITNITKPTVDLKVCIDIGVGYQTDLKMAQQLLEEIAIRHPNVLVSQPQIKNKIKVMENNKNALANDLYLQAIQKLKSELMLNEGIITFENHLTNLIINIRSMQIEGIEKQEKEAIKREIPRFDSDIQEIQSLLDSWIHKKDPWIDEKEHISQIKLFEKLNYKLSIKWEKIKTKLLSINYENEALLSLIVNDFKDWLNSDFKQVHDIYKDPSVSFKNFGASSINLSLEIYIDNIILEHFERKQRVVREVAFEMLQRLTEVKIEIPCQQIDIKMRQ